MTRHLAPLALLLAVAACGGPDAQPVDPANPVTQRISTSTDCAALQAEFDQAAANSERFEAGSTRARQALAYMEQADARMREVGCY